MQVIEWFLDKLFWGVVGGISTAIWFKATNSCVDTIIGISCVHHSFNLQGAFGF